MTLSNIVIITLIFNILCGIFRVRQTKLKWKLLYIHLPIPLIAYLRITSGISWKFIPLLVVVAVIGQMIGGLVNNKILKKTPVNEEIDIEEE